MAGPGEFKSNFTAGEFGPEVEGRIDIKPWYAGARRMLGVRPVPQGGFRLLPGSRRLAPWRRPLATMTQADPIVASGPFSGSSVAWQCTLPPSAAGAVAAVEITFSTSAAATVQVEVRSAAGTWSPFGGSYPAGPSTSRRLVLLPPGIRSAADAIRILVTPGAPGVVVTGMNAIAYRETGTPVAPTLVRLKTGGGAGLMLAVSAGVVDVWRGLVHVGGCRVPTVTSALVPEIRAYAEADTVGLFAHDLASLRLRRMTGDHDWALDDWPFEGIPKVDYGGSYTKITDEWEVWIRWASNDNLVSLVALVDGESTPAVTLGYDPGNPSWTAVTIQNAVAADWDRFCDKLEDEIEALPSLGPTVTVTWANVAGRVRLKIVFGGGLAGSEYDLTAQIQNTADVSALTTHTKIGKTIGEPVISAARGWPRLAALVQDRLAYAGLKARKAAVLMSQVGEYYQVDIERAGDSAPRLDAIRSQTAEEIRAVVDSKYFVVFTDRTVYFVPNRTISRNEPLNFVKTSSEGIGLAAGTDVIDIDDNLFFVGANGTVVYSAQYNDVTTSYGAAPQSLLGSHLVKGVAATAGQTPDDASDAARMWLMRGDGRLVMATIVTSQDILFALCEWALPDGDAVQVLKTDGSNLTWVCIERAGAGQIEVLEEGLLLQSAVGGTVGPDGRLGGLDHLEGRSVWIQADGDAVDGPFVVSAGRIEPGASWVGASVSAGLWRAPRVETMPLAKIVADNVIVRRPGRIHTAHVALLDTTSIAIGANGEAAEDVALTRAGDALAAPAPGRTEMLSVTGLSGIVDGPTLVITQLRPGRLAIRDVTMEAKL